MGIAIAGMHYIGMAAMQVDAILTYDPVLFALSVAIAITASIVALWLAFTLRRQEDEVVHWWIRIGAAMVMGIAICGDALHGDGGRTICTESGTDRRAGHAHARG